MKGFHISLWTWGNGVGFCWAVLSVCVFDLRCQNLFSKAEQPVAKRMCTKKGESVPGDHTSYQLRSSTTLILKSYVVFHANCAFYPIIIFYIKQCLQINIKYWFVSEIFM